LLPNGTPRDTANVARDTGLVQARVDHADTRSAYTDAGCHADARRPDTGPGRAHTHIACAAGLVDARIPDADARCAYADAGCYANAWGADTDARVARSRWAVESDDHQGPQRDRDRTVSEFVLHRVLRLMGCRLDDGYCAT
jgi:hypothetical protein